MQFRWERERRWIAMDLRPRGLSSKLLESYFESYSVDHLLVHQDYIFINKYCQQTKSDIHVWFLNQSMQRVQLLLLPCLVLTLKNASPPLNLLLHFVNNVWILNLYFCFSAAHFDLKILWPNLFSMCPYPEKKEICIQYFKQAGTNINMERSSRFRKKHFDLKKTKTKRSVY